MSELNYEHLFVLRHGEATGFPMRLEPKGIERIGQVSSEIAKLANEHDMRNITNIASPTRRALETLFILQDEIKYDESKKYPGMPICDEVFSVCPDIAIRMRGYIDRFIDFANENKRSPVCLTVAHDGFPESILARLNQSDRAEFLPGEGFYLNLKTGEYKEFRGTVA